MTEPILSSPSLQDSHQASDSEAASSPPAAFQRYKIRQEIGRGFSSIVYEAQDTVRGRRVALKVLNLEQTVNQERRQDMAERFLREARAISALSHPSIVSVYEVGQAGDGHHFIAMELLEGESLRTRMDREAPLGAEIAVPIALQTADALEYAHTRGIVHRDVKPDNIYVLPDGRVKLMDFGVAHIVSEGALTQTGTVVGSPAYMSPEQISGLPLSGSSDVFSLGVTLAEMLTGHKPFDAPSIPAVMNRILHRPPQIDGVQPRALRKVLAQSLAKSQTARYVTASAFAEALRRQVVPGSSPALSTDTMVMPAPLPRPAPQTRPAATDMAQEPPSRAALWTFGVAGLALLALTPFAFSHLSSTSPPTVNASVRVLPPAHQKVATVVPAPQVAHIPMAWGRQPVAHRVLSASRPERHALPASRVSARAQTVKSAAPLSPPASTAIAARPSVVQPSVIRPQTTRPLVAARPPAFHPAIIGRPMAVRPANMPRLAPVVIAKALPVGIKHKAATHALPLHGANMASAKTAPRTRMASALPSVTSAPRHAAAPDPVIRVAASRQEQITPPAPVVHDAPSVAAPAPRPVVIPNSIPRVLRRPAAVYPDNLRTSSIGGSVLMRLSVNAQGTVTEATVVRSSGNDDLDAAALDAVGHWFYEPAYQDGQAVPAEAVARIDFRP